MSTNHEKLTSAELANTWLTYMNMSALHCLTDAFLQHVLDEQVKGLLLECRELSQDAESLLKDIFHKEDIPVPQGFSPETDVSTESQRLYTDLFYLNFLLQKSKLLAMDYQRMLLQATREDVIELYEGLLHEAHALFRRATHVMLRKGVHPTPPALPYPASRRHVEHQSFTTGFLHPRRPLLAIEVSQLFVALTHNQLGKDFLSGLYGVTADKDIQKHISRGIKLSKAVMEDVREKLEEDGIEVQLQEEQLQAGSAAASLSDRLILCMVSGIANAGMSEYGFSMSVSMRRDLGALYAGFVTKAAAYGEDGLNLLIERGWLEQPPMSR
ncbi:DUF3231 family protein [Ectobacillus ponti]|uniref:DUF3231 family protein n=1 Tax=Ectobacillus ponti TaxID=2961894 RepID=A0AA41X6N3_9BACI|nr:DUF3231 family protein [Ectobacillus ponti]MCP8967805.1 DUF3231 family protein [Ectobacillus ponti]